MNIAVNVRFLIKNKLEGIGWFTFETLKRITQSHPEHHFYFLFDRNPSDEFIFSSNISPVVLHPQARHPLLWYIWFEYSVANFIKKNNIQLFLSTDGYMPLRGNVPSVVVIHDINFFHYPSALPPLSRYYYNHFFPKFAHKANRIVTVSEYSKNDIVTSFKVDESKVDVAYNGVNPIYSPVSDYDKNVTKLKYTNGKPYFVFVGALNPRKNVARLLSAFDVFCKNHSDDYALIVVGEKMFKTNEISEAYNAMKHKDSVVFTGRLGVEELRLVVGSALAMTYVPYFEGFGIPMLEAMNCHVPLIASNKTSMPEVAGDAAYYVDPFSIDSIANAMSLIAMDTKLREALVSKAIERKKLFSWDSTASKLYSSIQSVLNQNNY
jgi:glycosyltransferase involved in cell wall biosynthesis